MKIVPTALAVLAMLGTALVTLMAVVFCLASGANAAPEQIRVLKLWMIGLTSLGLAGIGAGIYLLRVGQPGRAAGASFLPTVIMVLILAVALLR
ncbi:MAG: hypothetical protein MNPFHGCM_00957 [Gemmatimonadaceae bacterium]|nr:hypothetical protein [Gemmatimonadaceae bacterium]